MKLIILSGSPAAGKNTIAEAYAKQHKKCAVIDVDTVRQMIRQPHKAPWEGKEGKAQQLLGVQNTCVLAKNFLKEGYSVIITDVLMDETAKIYKQELKKFEPHIILLLPTFDEIMRRSKLRTEWLTAEEIKMLYKQQESFTLYDTKIDNTSLAPEEISGKLNSI